MKSFTVATFLLSATAMAFPQAKRYSNSTQPSYANHTDQAPAPVPDVDTYPNAVCQPGKYQCHYDTYKGWGWDVCNTQSKWEYAGSCGSSEVCTFNPLNGSPYCVPAPSPKPAEPEKECYPQKYQCAYSEAKGWYINTCDASGHWKHELDCKPTETCTYSAVAGYPYCTPKADSPKTCTPGTYQCSYDNAKSLWGWQICTVEGQWVSGGWCKNTETCSFNPLNGSPYCL